MPVFKLFKYIKGKYWLLFGASIITLVTQVWLDLTIPTYMSEITILVKTEGSNISDIWSAGGMMMLCAAGSVIAAVVTGYLSSRFAATLSRSLREKVFNKVEDFSMEEIDGFSTASLITRSTNDITQIQNFVSRGMQIIIRAPIMAGIALYRISLQHWEWTAYTASMVVVVLLVIVQVVLYARPRFQKMQGLTDDLNRVTRENLTGIRVIRAYNAESYQENKFENANEKLTSNALHAQVAMSTMQPVIGLVNNMLTIGIYCIGAYLIAASPASGQLELFSEMVVFSTYAAKIIQAFMSLRMILMMLPRATVSAGRLNEVLDKVPSIIDGSETEGLKGEKGKVEFRSVSFKYPGTTDYVLKDINFTAEMGETIAFIGATGSGKTSLVNLLVRFYDADKGEVLVDGRNVRDYKQHSLRSKLGYAPQKAVLFTGTVRSNVSYGTDNGEGNDEEIKHALNIAQAFDFVKKMDGGIDAMISRGGTNVSGGQKQRLSIARAVYKKPEIYIFDDTFSALDYKTDRTLRGALKTETSGITSLIVAQRIGTIRDADKIIVLDEGRIVGEGTHSELLKSCEVYKEIARTQLSEEELRNA
jgi:ATP-binding cassette subfamily B multidrug efflux pump